ncbi:MAG TPA: BPTI/Kunitz-type proteinase inhibitor domain-containing protein, partial [Polyangiaceae bacterium]
IVDECWGPCVPADCCVCGGDVTCPNGDVACDAAEGRCMAAAAPEPRCSLPFEPLSCSGAARFAFIEGRCQETPDGVCGGNDNSFETIEECLRRCEGLPQQGECPEGRVVSDICLACGFGGGCRQWSLVCAKSCIADEDCAAGMSCVDSVCGANFCI